MDMVICETSLCAIVRMTKKNHLGVIGVRFHLPPLEPGLQLHCIATAPAEQNDDAQNALSSTN